MGSREREHPEARAAWDEMHGFINMGFEMPGTIGNFILQGPVDVPTHFRTFIGIYPAPDPSIESGYIVASQENYNAVKLSEKLLALRLPERVANLPVLEDRALERDLEAVMALTHFPSVVVAIGQAVKTGEEVVALFTIAGRTAQKALSILQERVRTRRRKWN